MSSKTLDVSRAHFFRRSAVVGAGLALAFYLPPRIALATDEPAAATTFAPNAWVRIAPDDTVTVVLNKSEMGQGVATGLPTILCEELDAAMDRVAFAFAPAEKAYIDPAFGDMLTGGSTSTADGWLPLRTAGATARAMLVSAAAAQWSVDASTCTTRAGVVSHAASGRTASYGSLAAAAAALPVPKDVPLKKPEDFVLVGKPRMRPDIPLKVNGTAGYGIDVKVPGMVYAAIARSPRVRRYRQKRRRS